ncbi:hypothetical protein V1477_006081 [Vespula maculifrons]|uniref:Uncharacterized protein n=2 Tax=Vespula TaxID=7451 RepID=A0A834J6Y8_VESVU|nr:hypothetical protein HZH66_013240 [Vespula vulgaris]
MKETFLGAFDVRDYRRYKIPRAGNVLLWKETSRTERNGIGENKERKKERKSEQEEEGEEEEKQQGNRSGASGDGDRNGRDGDASMVVLVGVRGRGKETKEEKNGFTKVAFRACSELFVELSSHRE